MSPGPKRKYSGYLSIRLEPELRKLLQIIADQQERTASQMARILLRSAIEFWPTVRDKVRRRKNSSR
jgi:predicted transcriptional regulator